MISNVEVELISGVEVELISGPDWQEHKAITGKTAERITAHIDRVFIITIASFRYYFEEFSSFVFSLSYWSIIVNSL
ncbi:MAG: hypothetical protein IJY82_02730 [Oscillospiraceae bacterium]|nr:hypothetical protein [Oscillospiraceae bacterium]